MKPLCAALLCLFLAQAPALCADAPLSDSAYYPSLIDGPWTDVTEATYTAPAGEPGWSVHDGRLNILWPTPTGTVARTVHLRLRDAKSGLERGIDLTPRMERQGDRIRLHQELPDWQVSVEAVIVPRGPHLEGAVRVRGLSGEDVPLRVEWVMDTPGVHWRWWDDARHSRVIDRPSAYANMTRVLAGYDGQMSRYPYACISSADEALAIGVPLLRPRVFQLVYDGKTAEYRLAVDFALSPSTVKFPNEATFFFVLYPTDPALGFRGALERYGEIYPEAFIKRVEREGVWMPFTLINDVRDAQDFHFGFHEYGAVDFDYNARHGIYSFLYVEPWTYWMAMEPGVPRETAVALEQLKRNAIEGDAWNRSMAKATLSSAVFDPTGQPVHQFVDQPWCSGTLFFNNSDPDVPVEGEDGINAGRLNLEVARNGVVELAPPPVIGWEPVDRGFMIDPDQAHSGQRSLRVDRAPTQGPGGALRRIDLNQEQPSPLVIRAWSRSQGVVRVPPDDDYAVYCDVYFADGSTEYGVTVPMSVSDEWRQAERTYLPEKAVRKIHLHLLFRGAHTGTVWFDDVSLADAASGREWIVDGGFEGNDPSTTPTVRSDGMYLDSLEGWANRLNFRADHFAAVDIPLVFETGSGRTAIFNLFSIFEFTQTMAEYLHAHDRLLMGNWVLIDFPFLGALLDVPGKEVHWLDDQHAFAPDPDEVMLYRRSLSGQKPYPLLLNVRFEHFTPAMMRKYFERALFYAFYPGMFSHDAASNPYFENPALYERDRDLFLEIIPIVQELSAAGWEPVTRASSSNPQVLIERYGHQTESGLYFAVHHDGEGWEQGEVTLDATALGLSATAHFIDVRDGVSIPATYQDGQWTFTTRLDAYATRVIRVIDDQAFALVAFAREKLDALRTVIARHEEQGKMSTDRAEDLRHLLDVAAKEIALPMPPTADGLRNLCALVEGYGQQGLSRAVARAENAMTDVLLHRWGLSMAVSGVDALISPSKSRGVWELMNGGPEPVTLQSVRLVFTPPDGRSLEVEDPEEMILTSGETLHRSIKIDVPEGLDIGADCTIRIEVNVLVTRPDEPAVDLKLIRNARARVMKGFEWGLTPERTLTVQSDRSFHIELANHRDEGRDVKLSARVEGPHVAQLSWTQQVVRVEACSRQRIALGVGTPAPVGRAEYRVTVTAAADDEEWGNASATMIRFPSSKNVLLDDEVEVLVDSTYPGYSIAALRDGIVDTTGLGWAEAAWASADLAVPHWVEARWPTPRRIRSVTVHWAEDAGAYLRSTKYRIQYRLDEKWVDLPGQEVAPSDADGARYEFDPLVTDGIRFWQEAGGGPESRPNLLWIRELEVRDE